MTTGETTGYTMRAVRGDYDDGGEMVRDAIYVQSVDGQAGLLLTGAHGTVAEARREAEVARLEATERIDWGGVS